LLGYHRLSLDFKHQLAALFDIEQSMLSISGFLVSLFVVVLSTTTIVVQAFVSMPSPPHSSISRGRSSSLSNDSGGIEEIEFRIYPDGRVTEIVKGVKGKNCQEVTACKWCILLIFCFYFVYHFCSQDMHIMYFAIHTHTITYRIIIIM